MISNSFSRPVSKSSGTSTTTNFESGFFIRQKTGQLSADKWMNRCLQLSQQVGIVHECRTQEPPVHRARYNSLWARLFLL